MKKFTCLQALEVIPIFLLLHAKKFPDFRELGPTIISSMCVFTWEEKRPGVMKTWSDWKKATHQILDGNVYDTEKMREIYNPCITWEQGFVAAYYLLDEYYWEQNNQILIEDVVYDLTKNLEENMEVFNSIIWKEWIEKVKKSLGYNFEYD